MNPAAVLALADQAGVSFSISAAGTLKATRAGGLLVTLKNLVRSEVRSGVRVRKKCLNHPEAVERSCYQSIERLIKFANKNLV